MILYETHMINPTFQQYGQCTCASPHISPSPAAAARPPPARCRHPPAAAARPPVTGGPEAIARAEAHTRGGTGPLRRLRLRLLLQLLQLQLPATCQRQRLFGLFLGGLRRYRDLQVDNTAAGAAACSVVAGRNDSLDGGRQEPFAADGDDAEGSAHALALDRAVRQERAHDHAAVAEGAALVHACGLACMTDADAKRLAARQRQRHDRCLRGRLRRSDGADHSRVVAVVAPLGRRKQFANVEDEAKINRGNGRYNRLAVRT